MFGDVSNHERIIGIKAACKYLAKKKIGKLTHWEGTCYAYVIPSKILILFTTGLGCEQREFLVDHIGYDFCSKVIRVNTIPV